MKTYTKEELNEILHRHTLWLADEPDGVCAFVCAHGRKNK